MVRVSTPTLCMRPGASIWMSHRQWICGPVITLAGYQHGASRHRLSRFEALRPHLRRTFCPQCWAEEGPYRRREWAHPWSLMCLRHRRLLSETPPPTFPHSRGTMRNPGRSFTKHRICGGTCNLPGKVNGGGGSARLWGSSHARNFCARGLGSRSLTTLRLDQPSGSYIALNGSAGCELGIQWLWCRPGAHGLRSNGLARPDLYGLIRFIEQALLKPWMRRLRPASDGDHGGGVLCDYDPKAPRHPTLCRRWLSISGGD